MINDYSELTSNLSQKVTEFNNLCNQKKWNEANQLAIELLNNFEVLSDYCHDKTLGEI